MQSSKRVQIHQHEGVSIYNSHWSLMQGQFFIAFKCLPSQFSLWSDQHQWSTTNLPLVNIPLTACIYASDPQLQREAEPHRETEAYHMKWLQGFSHCLTQPCVYGDRGPQFLPWVLIVQAESNFIDCVCVRHDHIEAILHEEDREREQDVVRETCVFEHFTTQETHNPLLWQIRVRLYMSLYIIVEHLVPGSSWSLSSTWCTHAHHPFGSQDGSSWWFCCSKLCHSCNRWQKLIFGRESITEISV